MSSSDPHSSFLGLPKLPAHYANIILPFFLSLLMTCIVSLVSTLRGVGWTEKFFAVWPSAWVLSWVIAFPVLLIVLPVVRKITMALVRTS